MVITARHRQIRGILPVQLALVLCPAPPAAIRRFRTALCRVSVSVMHCDPFPSL